MPMTKDAVARWEAQGFVPALDVLSPAEATETRARFDDLEARVGPEHAEIRLHDRHFDEEFVWRRHRARPRLYQRPPGSLESRASKDRRLMSTVAQALAGPLGMRPLVAHCHLGLGRLYRHTGKRQQPQEHLSTATTMYHEIDMGFWLMQAEAGAQRGGLRPLAWYNLLNRRTPTHPRED